MSMKSRGRGNIHERRNLAEFDSHDPYAPKIDPGEVAVCTTCHAIFHRRHWFFDPEVYFHESQQPETQKIECPACHKIRDRFAEGRVTLQPSSFLTAHREEILHLIYNEEERAKGINPLERIVEMIESDDGMVITTTNEKLAQRIGRTLKSTFQGQTTYHWSDPKFLSVVWHRADQQE
jgi:NMD protein affecting ribosome stability and mRNA decay